MTTGAPIYLVSACSSAEEFVAAFRRYADRTGLFIPMAEPLPAGRTGRLALTLSDGGVMIEGVAQVVTSSTKPVGLYGRPGITLKFTEPDDPSKTVIAELEKARLALRPLPPSVPPRKAEVPAQPRAKPPAIVGRIDAQNALAETVAIGDLATLKESAGDPGASGALPKAGQKFVVPSVPSIPGVEGRAKSPTTPPEGRPKTPTRPPPAEPRAKTPTSPPSAHGTAIADALKAAAPPAAAPAPVAAPVASKPPEPPPTPPTKSKRPTKIGMPAVDKLPVEKLTAEMRPPAPPGKSVLQTQPLPLATASADASASAAKPTRDDPTTPAAKSPAPAAASKALAMPRHPTPFAPLPVARLPANGAPVVSASAAVVEEVSESTDVTTVPEPALPAEDSKPAEKPPEEAKPQRSGGMRASEIMAAIPSDDWTMTPDASGPVVLPASAKAAAAADSEQPLVIESKQPPKGPPTGDWTIPVDPSAPDGWGTPEKLKKAETPTPVPTPAPAPAAKEKEKPATGNPVHAVSSKKELEVQEWEDKPTGIGQPLVEIDSTLMEPLKPMPPLDEPVKNGTGQTAALRPTSTGPSPQVPANPSGPSPVVPPLAQPHNPSGGFEHVGTPPPLAPPPLAPPPLAPQAPAMMAPQAQPDLNPGFTGPMPQATGPQPVYPRALDPQQQIQMMGFPRMVSDAGTGFFRDSGNIPHYPIDAAAAEGARRRRVLFIAVGSAVAAVALVVVIIMATGGKKTAAGTRPTDPGTTTKMMAATGSGSGSASPAVAVAPPTPTPTPTPTPATDTGSAAPQVATPTPTPTGGGGCKVEVTTNPPGAQVSIDKDSLGVTPATIELPCDTEAKLKIYKAKYFGQIKSVTPTSEGTKVDLVLAPAIYTVKVTSVPAGATINVGGKPMGVTPTTIKVPAFAPSTIVISKDGFTPDSQKITPKQNGMAHHVALKKLTLVKGRK